MAESQDLEWEEWDSQTSPLSFGHHCLAGSFAGVVRDNFIICCLFVTNIIFRSLWVASLSKGSVREAEPLLHPAKLEFPTAMTMNSHC